MPRTQLDFGGDASPGIVYLRMIVDEPNFILIHNITKQTMKVEQLTLHIDFMRAELYPHDVGPGARGLGVVEFGEGGPQIIDRKMGLIDSTAYGFVFEMASPYPLGNLPNGIAPHAVASTFRAVRQSMSQAYELYSTALGMTESIGGVPLPNEPGYMIPVFEVERWRRGDNAKNVFGQKGSATYLPEFKLVGMVQHIASPLTKEQRNRFLRPKARRVEVPDDPTPSMMGGLPDESGGLGGTEAELPNRSLRRKLTLPPRGSASVE